MMLATSRQVTNNVANTTRIILINQWETFMTKDLAGYILPLLNPMLATEEVEHAANND